MSTTSEYRARRMPAPPKVPKLRVPASFPGIPGDLWVIGALTLLAAVLRFATIASQSYWADEALTAYEVHLRFGGMLRAVSQLETTPPLYFILAWAWYHVLGTSEAALRSLSALAGVTVVPVTYMCGRELVSRRAGVIAAAFAAVNPFLIWYSQEARAYMLLIALTGASFLFFARALRSPSRGNILGWTIFSALALGTHFFAGFLVAPEALWLLLRARNRGVILASGTLAVVQVALLPLAAGDTNHGVGWIHKTPLLTRIAQVPAEFGVSTVYRHVTTTEGLWGGAIVLAVALLLLLLAGGSAEWRGAGVAGVIAASVLSAPLVLGLIRPIDDFFLVRNLSAAWIPLSVVLAAGFSAPRSRDAGIVAASALLAVFVIATYEIETNPVFQRADWRGVARVLGAASERRAILVVGGQQAIALNVFLPGVNWVQPPPTQRVVVDQIAVVGSKSRAPVRGPGRRRGAALPVSTLRGAVYLGHRWVRNFDVAEYALNRPWRFDSISLYARASRFFHHAPVALLVLVQRPTPGARPSRLIAPRTTEPVVLPRRGAPHRGARHRGARHRGARHRGARATTRAGRARLGRRSSGRRLASALNLTVEGVPLKRCLEEVEPVVTLLRQYQCWRLRSQP